MTHQNGSELDRPQTAGNRDDLQRISEVDLKDAIEDAAEKASSKTVIRMADTMELTIEERLFIKDFYQAVKSGRQRIWGIVLNVIVLGALLGTLTAVWQLFKSKIQP